MMNTPLTLVSMIERAETYFAKKEVVSRTNGGIHRLTYRDIGQRTRALSSSLEKLGVGRGDRVASLAWNHHRHLEAYFAAPCMGAVLHMTNFRLPGEHLSYILNHAEDKVLLVDEDIVPLVEKIQSDLKTVKAFVIMTDQALPETSLSPVYSYESLISEGDETYEFADDIDENETAGMCYTSATTGHPKGVEYSHRGLTLHSFAVGLADTAALSESDVLLPVVPMFHVNAWGMPYAATWFGTKQVLPGPYPTPQLLAELIESEKVTSTAGVPTVWLGLLNELRENDYDMSSLRSILCGGSAAPRGLIRAFESEFNIPFIHAYGMTETTPIVTLARLKSYQNDWSEDDRLDVRSTQGMVVPGLDVKVMDEEGHHVKQDGEDMGELLIRGPWIADQYYNNDEQTAGAFQDGWLYTGDVATMDAEGNINLVDRSTDLVKSGGEWISSVAIENALMAHRAVFEAAVIAAEHPKWQERPIACVVLQQDADVSKDDLLAYIEPQFAKWWLPDDVIFVDSIPKTSVGKFMKRALRQEHGQHLVQS